MIIAVASGKGGTGKTTVATSLALTLTGDSSPSRPAVRFLDCDVEEPNAALFLHPLLEQSRAVGILVPQVDPSCCTLCGRCGQVCAYHAIVVAGKKVLVFPEMCHGCGSCTVSCEPGAIREVLHAIGTVESGRAGSMHFASGTLNVGEAMPVPLIRALKQDHLAGCSGTADQVAILDAPPGTSCPVVQTMLGADFVLLVTEPTPFGLHDLQLAVDVARGELGIPVGVVVNRDGCGDSSVDEYCAHQGIPILMRIPLDRSIARAIARGRTLVEAFPEYRPRFASLYSAIQKQVPS
jgi:MinD superfamily P-loop ATPase